LGCRTDSVYGGRKKGDVKRERVLIWIPKKPPGGRKKGAASAKNRRLSGEENRYPRNGKEFRTRGERRPKRGILVFLYKDVSPRGGRKPGRERSSQNEKKKQGAFS